MDGNKLIRQREARKNRKETYYTVSKDDLSERELSQFQGLDQIEEHKIEEKNKEYQHRLDGFKFAEFIPEFGGFGHKYETMTKGTIVAAMTFGFFLCMPYMLTKENRIGAASLKRIKRRDRFFYVGTCLVWGYIYQKTRSDRDPIHQGQYRTISDSEKVNVFADKKFSTYDHIDPLIEEQFRYSNSDRKRAHLERKKLYREEHRKEANGKLPLI